ncbi:MAG: hypothetical protein AB7F96_16585 [Beijerinckiaceae bacterium]
MRYDEWRGSFDGRPTLWIKVLVARFGCKVQLHKFIRADDPGAFHTHPAWALRVVLWGGYVEETGDGRWRTWWPGKIGIVWPSYEHRIGGLRNGRVSYSLWLRGPKVAQIETRGYS